MAPFLSPWGGLSVAADITYDQRNKDGVLEQKGNGLEPLRLTVGKDCSYDAQNDNYKEQVWTGTPEPKKANEQGGMNWITTPVWRVVTNRFNEAEWERFIAYYIRCVDAAQRPNVDRVIWYQPDLIDVEIRDYDPIGLHLPVDKLEFILNEKCLVDKTMTIFEESLLHSQINRAGTKMMTKDQQTRFKKAFEYRKKQEANPDVEPEEYVPPVKKTKSVA